MWGCVQPARGGGGTHSWGAHMWGTNMGSLLGGFRAPQEGRTVNTPILRRGSRVRLPLPTPEQDSTQARPTVGSGQGQVRLLTFAAVHPAPRGLLPA